MKTNIRLLRGNVAAPALEVSRANNLKQHHQTYCDTQVPRTRPALIMIWRTHPANGRLECRWALEDGTANDEGVSCSKLLRQAA